MKKDGCGVHPDNKVWLYVFEAEAEVCLECLKAGFYNGAITREAKDAYPAYFEVKDE